MGYILLTGILAIAVCLLTIKGFKRESILLKIFHVGALVVGVLLVILAIIGIVALGENIT
ncbi:hypothetical protein [Halobacillus naozhouensis]|uniref:Uncharacterized protein n=1 Tax=Halobacillus naozhouensis TaxID=554880 RepID=A0ABY8J512_9BACI|nr:hypothetical protein [Halobacillus naozhouensis]WFT76523.1 hypothetical protein P9989_09235 [Halobacillus naozhouensis]